MAMGNPLSPVLSNLYIEFFKENLLSQILPSNAIWYRYVDDVLCLRPCNEDIYSFMSTLNTLVPSVKFTFELDINFKIPFIDVLIYRVGKNFKYNAYRKPTNMESYVHYYSAHHRKVKAFAFSFMFLRALRICSPEFMEN